MELYSILLSLNYFPSRTVELYFRISFLFFLRCVCLLFLAVLGLSCYTQAFPAWVSGGAVRCDARASHSSGFPAVGRGL